ncbi:hypothetical protein E2C01_073513 [Portunus trituberculatus]|uniref:Uncharacterized protein n=1 Tax=Portunus trituberculatus TaxID=210409 RepID=A0A5B7I5J5_PORTR|nr:hypothetical protein [Portunus trituberculatus]
MIQQVKEFLIDFFCCSSVYNKGEGRVMPVTPKTSGKPVSGVSQEMKHVRHVPPEVWHRRPYICALPT